MPPPSTCILLEAIMETHPQHPFPQPETLDSALLTHAQPLCPNCSQNNRMPAYVQIAIRSRSKRALYPCGLNVMGHPFTSVPAKTTALIPLVFQNDSHVWAKRNNPGSFHKKNIGCQKCARTIQTTTPPPHPTLSSYAKAKDPGRLGKLTTDN